MLKRIVILSFVFAFAASSLFAQGLTKAQKDQLSRISYKVSLVGDALVGERVDGKGFKHNFVGPTTITSLPNNFTREVMTPDANWTFTYVMTGGETIYDLESNGTPVQIWQDPTTPANIHTVLTTAPLDDLTFTNRRSKYYFSSDLGVTWAYVGEAGNVKTGFCTITGTSEGNALIGNHGNSNGGATRTQFYYDALPGLGSFTILDPPVYQTNGYIWPRVIPTTNISNPVKFAFVGSISGQDTTFRSYSNSLAASNFGPWTAFNSDQAETYALALGQDGRLGLAYKSNDVWDPADYGDAYFVESTDGGVSWSTPLKIYKANFDTGDSLGLIRGISMVYQGNSPKVVFELIKQTREGTFFPGAPAKIAVWSSSFSGSDPNKWKVLADSNQVGYHPAFGVNDVFGSICRPTIGKSADGNALFCAFMVPSDFAGGSADTTPYKDIWLATSGDMGNTWGNFVKVNFESPRRDWTYVSVTPVNDQDANFYYVNMAVLVDSVPGSFVNGTGNGQSLGKQYYVRAKIPKTDVSVKNISTEIPANYSLSQNYPNPFNPSTTIRFALPKASDVTLKVYNINGQEVATLINGMNMNAGTSEYTFDASKLSSGVYFYSIQAGNFKDTKKMILVK